MSRRSEILDDATKDRIQQQAGVHHVKIERRELMAEMQLGIIVATL